MEKYSETECFASREAACVLLLCMDLQQIEVHLQICTLSFYSCTSYFSLGTHNFPNLGFVFAVKNAILILRSFSFCLGKKDRL